MTTYTATYSPDDNKLRLSASSRLDAETYARVKAAGFAWAPKQEQFIAPMWTPERADLCVELAGEIEDEDSSLIERAEVRADRFDDYSEERTEDANRAREAVARIADGIPLGQPILVGHHSERRARRDAEKIENGMRKAVQLWETAGYWKHRAAAALAHARYKERPDVRHRRIRTIEADARKMERRIADAEKAARIWDKVPRFEWDKQTAVATYIAGRDSTTGYNLYSDLSAGRIHGDTAWRRALAQCEASIAHARRWLDHYENRLAYERAMLADGGGIAADKFQFEVGGQVLSRGEWATILRITKKDGAVSSLGTNRRFCPLVPVDEVSDYRAPSRETAEKVKAATKLAPLANYPGDGFLHMTKREWELTHTDYKASRELGTGAKADRWGKEPPASANVYQRHRVRSVVHRGALHFVFLSDSKIVEPPKVGEPTADEKKRVRFKPAADVAEGERLPAETPAPQAVIPPPQRTYSAPAPRAEADPAAADFEAMRASLRAGVQTVSAPQLFPTPPALAERMAAELHVYPSDRIMEPSAGTGRLLDGLAAYVSLDRVHLHVWELNTALRERLRDAYPDAIVHAGDFLASDPAYFDSFDAIVMNPPFADGADVAHVAHALRFLRPGGRLVAIMSAGITFRSDRKTREFRELIEAGGRIEELPADTFAGSGTGVNTVLIVYDKPEAAAMACAA